MITGGGGGIGLATARAFAKAGWKVLALDKDFSQCNESFSERIDFDLKNLKEIKGLVEKKEIHTLVNNAGVLFCDPYDSIPDEHKREVLTVNIEAPAALITALAPQMKARKSGRIVNVGANAALKAALGMGAYAASKAGVHSLTQALAEELKADGVTVNAVLPSIIDTPANRADMPKADCSTWVAPEDLAAVMLFLASEEARAVTGALLPVTGRV